MRRARKYSQICSSAHTLDVTLTENISEIRTNNVKPLTKNIRVFFSPSYYRPLCYLFLYMFRQRYMAGILVPIQFKQVRARSDSPRLIKATTETSEIVRIGDTHNGYIHPQEHHTVRSTYEDTLSTLCESRREESFILDYDSSSSDDEHPPIIRIIPIETFQNPKKKVGRLLSPSIRIFKNQSRKELRTSVRIAKYKICRVLSAFTLFD